VFVVDKPFVMHHRMQLAAVVVFCYFFCARNEAIKYKMMKLDFYR